MTFAMKSSSVTLIFISIFCFVWAEVVEYHPCQYILPREQKCEIHKVEILPCPEADQNETCLLYKNTNSTVNFEFTPAFNSTKLYAQAYSASYLIDLPLPGQDTNGCHYTSCPIVAREKRSFQFSLPIADYYPAGPYLAKWRIWSENNEECCFTTNIAIV